MPILYTALHQWIGTDAGHDAARVGITVHAQDTLGDIVFVELPAVGKTYAQGDVVAVVESVKTAADVYMPVAGEVVEVNAALQSEPALVNSAPEAEGWLFKMRVANPSALDGLMDAAGYAAQVAAAAD